MTVDLMAPGSTEWLKLVTASKVAAIIGVSSWDSPRSMWHKMRNELPPEAETKVQSRGHYLEPAVLAWWRDQHPEYGMATEQPCYVLDDWAAATPDMAVWDEGLDLAEIDSARPSAIAEAKSARDLDEQWGDPGTDVIPTYYLTQVYWQLHVSHAPLCYVPIVGPFLDFAEYVVHADAEIGADLEARCRVFYDSLLGDVPPDLDDSVATYDAIRKLHAGIDFEQTAELSPAEAREYIEAVNTKRDAEARERAAKSLLLDRMGNARFALCEGVKVARRQPNKTGISIVQVAKTTTDIPEGNTP